MSLSEYQRRRQQLMKLMAPGSIAVLPASRLQIRNRDTEHLFRQNSDFYYLTGFDEPNAVLVLAPGREHGEVILFCEEREPGLEQWTGERMGPDRATQMLGVDDGFPIGDLRRHPARPARRPRTRLRESSANTPSSIATCSAG